MLTAIYTLADPSTGEIRYVGKTRIALGKRLGLHLSDARRLAKDTYLLRWLRTLLRAHVVPAMAVIEWVEGDRWEERERYWIATYRAAGLRLVNTTPGGQSVDIPRTPEWRAKAGAALKGRVISAEQRALLRAAMLRKVDENGFACGHPATPENTGYNQRIMGRKHRYCRACNIAMKKDWYDRTRRKTRIYTVKEACVNGHPLAGDNVYYHSGTDGYVKRHCRACKRERKAAARRRKKEGGA